MAQTPAPGIVAYRSMVSLTAAVASSPGDTVINLIGDSVPVAREKAARDQVRLIFEPPESARIARARVWFQDPRPGGTYDGDSITVQVEYPLARVVSLSLGQAAEILKGQFLRWEIQGSIPTVIPAFVRATQPEPDNWVRPGQTIVVLPGVELADYRGRIAREAGEELRQQGFEPRFGQGETRQAPEGEVVAQTPPPGIVAFGSIVNLTLAVAPPNWIPFAVGGGLIALVAALLFWLKTGAAAIAPPSKITGRPAEQPESPPGVTFRPRTDAGRQSVTSGPQAKDGKGFSIRIRGDSGTQRVLFPHDPASEEEI